MNGDEFRKTGHELVERIAELLEGLPDRPVTRASSPETIRAAIGAAAGLPEQGMDAREALHAAADVLFEHSLYNGHPRFWGYITSSPAPVGILADFLASAVNPNVGAWKLAPVATEIEVQTVRWLAELTGFPADCGGLLVSGGNMANILCFYAARAAQAPGDVRKAGVGSQRLRVYASRETHTWIEKAADFSGLGTDAIRWIAVDDQFRMDLEALREQVAKDRAAGDIPMVVVGTAGSVGTGAVDDLPGIAAFCKEQGLWFHVDGAYGALAARAPGSPADLAGLALADSVAVDPHKWLWAPLEAGCALVRDPKHLRQAFSYHASYYNFDHSVINYFDVGMQNSRGFRALKVWMILKQAGREGILQRIAEECRLARKAYALLEAHPEFEVMTQGLSITTFQYVPRGFAGSEEELNRLNQELLDKIEKSGELFISTARVQGKFALRMCIVNFRTRDCDIEALPEMIARMGRECHAERQGR